ITPSTIEFADVANPRSHRILTIADIVGYDKTKNVPKGPEMPKFGTELPPPVQTELPPLKPRDGKNNPILSIPNVDFISGPPAPKKQSSENPGDSTAPKPPLKVGNFKVIGLEEP
ncbi:MAG: hypothetical protein K2X66_16065, partial [Cyanobacteria bacterium]|nr:hypothetical protein [Cyanobacteriota bacterium]